MKDPAHERKMAFRRIVEQLDQFTRETIESGRWAPTSQKLILLRKVAILLNQNSGHAPASVKRAVHRLQEAEKKVAEGITPEERLIFIRKTPLPRRRVGFRRKGK